MTGVQTCALPISVAMPYTQESSIVRLLNISQFFTAQNSLQLTPLSIIVSWLCTRLAKTHLGATTTPALVVRLWRLKSFDSFSLILRWVDESLLKVLMVVRNRWQAGMRAGAELGSLPSQPYVFPIPATPRLLLATDIFWSRTDAVIKLATISQVRPASSGCDGRAQVADATVLQASRRGVRKEVHAIESTCGAV